MLDNAAAAVAAARAEGGGGGNGNANGNVNGGGGAQASALADQLRLVDVVEVFNGLPGVSWLSVEAIQQEENAL